MNMCDSVTSIVNMCCIVTSIMNMCDTDYHHEHV